MNDATSKREETLIKKYGGKAELAAKRREWQLKASLVNSGNRGYAQLKKTDPERLSKIQSENAKKRWSKNED